MPYRLATPQRPPEAVSEGMVPPSDHPEFEARLYRAPHAITHNARSPHEPVLTLYDQMGGVYVRNRARFGAPDGAVRFATADRSDEIVTLQRPPGYEIPEGTIAVTGVRRSQQLATAEPSARSKSDPFLMTIATPGTETALCAVHYVNRNSGPATYLTGADGQLGVMKEYLIEDELRAATAAILDRRTLARATPYPALEGVSASERHRILPAIRGTEAVDLAQAVHPMLTEDLRVRGMSGLGGVGTRGVSMHFETAFDDRSEGRETGWTVVRTETTVLADDDSIAALGERQVTSRLTLLPSQGHQQLPNGLVVVVDQLHDLGTEQTSEAVVSYQDNSVDTSGDGADSAALVALDYQTRTEVNEAVTNWFST
ncbi:MAG TPA: hypothetical protein VMB52_02475 [Verrucomicrobiae bacterium]|nr:hypothetical protein [Verrucomicrobiae bacterium]